MDDALFIILMVVGLIALYWALFGQWKYNKLMGLALPSDVDILKAQIKEYAEKVKKEEVAKKKAKKKKSSKKSSKK